METLVLRVTTKQYAKLCGRCRLRLRGRECGHESIEECEAAAKDEKGRSA
jgi:hypothetical protein